MESNDAMRNKQIENTANVWKEIRDYEAVKDYIRGKVIHAEWNREELTQLVHICFLDLAMVFQISIGREENCDLAATIRPELLEEWRITERDLAEQTMINMQKYAPAVFVRAEDALRQMGCQIAKKKEYPLTLVRAGREINGAAVICYPDVFQRYAKEKSCGYVVILPSSIHELLVIPRKERPTQEELREFQTIVRMVNETQVPPLERLSDQVYLYSDQENRISLLEHAEFPCHDINDRQDS